MVMMKADMRQQAAQIVRDYFSDYARNAELGISQFMKRYNDGLPRAIERAAARARKEPLRYLLDHVVDDPSVIEQANALYTPEHYPNLYQQRGAKSIVGHKRYLIGDEVGTGKTLQAVIAKKELDKRRGQRTRTLVICPKTMKQEWRTKIWEYCPGTEDVRILDGYSKQRLASASDADFVISNYEAFSGKNGDLLAQQLVDAGFDFVVLDEAHHAKNPNAHRSEGRIKRVADSAEYLALLSGTPIPNNINDAYMLISMLDPASYATAAAVRHIHQNNPDIVGGLLRSRMQRWTRDMVNDLPGELKEEYRFVDLDEAHRAAYDAILNYELIYGGEKLALLRKALVDPVLLSPAIKQSERIKAKVGKIFGNNPELLAHPPESSKYRALDEIVDAALAAGEKIVVFTSLFKEGVTKNLQERYARYGALRIDGDVVGNERTRVRYEFQTNSDCKVLVATTRTTGEGISLTAANTLVFIDEPYTPTERAQAIGRAYRRGQKGNVRVITLLARNTVDEGVREFLNQKAEGIQRLVDGVPYDEFKKYLDALAKGPEHQKPIGPRLYTPEQTDRQKLRRHFGRMQGMDYERIRHYLEQNGDDIAELYAELWEGSVSENAAKVYTQIVRAIGAKEGALEKKVDIGSGPAILSRATGDPTVNVDINRANFRKARQFGNPRNGYIAGALHRLPLATGAADLALCSLALYYTKLGETTQEREDAVREAWRILKDKRYYITVFPDQVIAGREGGFLKGLDLLGFDIVPEFTGHVKATEPKGSDFRVYVATAQKAGVPSPGRVHMPFNTDFSRTARGRRERPLAPPQPHMEVCERFAFYDPETGTEDVEQRVEKYLHTERAAELKRHLDALPVASQNGREYVVIQKKGYTIKHPKERIAALLEQLASCNGVTRKELADQHPALYSELKRLKLLKAIPA